MLADSTKRPTALLCFNDMVALGAYHAAYELSLDIPRDLSVIGFDNVDLCALLNPSLTSVGTSPVEQGARAARLLIEIIRNDGVAGGELVKQLVEPVLIERHSVRQIIG